jgi:Secretion system C-terminal sorting domain
VISNVNAGSNIVQCNNGIFTLNGSLLATGEVGIWTKLNPVSPGTITNINANNTTVTGLNVGDSINLIWTATTSEGCIKSDTVALVNKAELIASTSFTSAAYCDNPAGIDLIGNAPAPGSGSWSLVAAPVGSPPIIWTNQNTATANIKNLGVGAYYFRYTINNLPCAPSTKDVLIKSNCVVLPVNIVSFTAQPNNNIVLLKWTVDAQININRYSLEHCTDGINFTAFTSVIANNFSTYNYQTTHNNPIAGINYYRIKIIENDGSFSYSEIRIVNMKNKKNDISIYPIPAKDILTIVCTPSILHKPATINIFAADGKLVLNKRFATLNQIETLNITGLISGNYILQVVTDVEVVNKKIEVVR